MTKPIPAAPYGGPAIHPGETLREDFLEPLGLSRNELARALRVPVMRISDICAGKRSITADTALRLGRYFGTSAQFWLNLQNSFDLAQARDQGADILHEVTPRELVGA